MMIHALAAYQPKEALRPFEYEPTSLGLHDIEIKITHCGICHSDIHLIDNDWNISKYPLVPGHEIAGEIIAVGSEVKHIKIGQRVGVGWQSGSCHTCEWCRTGFENLCGSQQATCVGKYGGFAERIITDSRFAFPLPDNLESENAAPLMCGGITVYSPLRHYGVRHFHKVGVMGIGGLGHLAIQFARAMGCEVTAFSTTPGKEAEARAFGASRFILSGDKAMMKKAAGSLDFILSTVAVPMPWASFVNLLRPNGRLCFVGATPSSLDVPVNMLMMGQKSVSGSVIGGRGMIAEMLEFAARHSIQAMTEALPMSEVNRALDKVRQNQARYRMVLVNR